MTLLKIPISQEPLAEVELPDGTIIPIYPSTSYYGFWTQIAQDALGNSTTFVQDTVSGSGSDVQAASSPTRQYGRLAYQNVVSLHLPVQHEPDDYTITTEPAGTIFTNKGSA